MSRGLLLIIEDDEWVARLLATALVQAGYEVIVKETARDGLATASTRAPDCIVCDVVLPDEDGFWLARHLRTLASPVAVTPLLFLSGRDDQASRLEGFHVGADVYLTKPFRVDEVVAQVDALVQMAARLRLRRDALRSLPPPGDTAIEGEVGQMSIATVLTVLEMERRTGLVEVVSKKRRAQLEIAGGCVVDGRVGGTSVSPIAALRTMLGWTVGRFSYTPAPDRPPPAQRTTIGGLLMEAVRLEDEAARAELELPPSRRARLAPRGGAVVLGGPASMTDLAPPSVRRTGHVEEPPSSAPISVDIDMESVPSSIDVVIDSAIPETTPASSAPATELLSAAAHQGPKPPPHPPAGPPAGRRARPSVPGKKR